MTPRPAILATLVLTSLGCDPLVGGACDEGYQADGSRCVPMPSDGSSEGAGGEGFDPGAGGAGPVLPLDDERSEPLVCSAELTACGDLCVDVTNDISHCGACGQHCPTEVCVAGQCLGDPVGHKVVIGMSYEQSNAASRRVLGNAIFRTLHEPLRVLEVRSWASKLSRARVTATIEEQAALRGRTILTTAVAPHQLGAALDIAAFDVLLLHDPQLSAPDDLEEMAMAQAESMAAFSAAGGTIVALASGQGVDPCPYLTAADLFPCQGTENVTGSAVYNALPSDTVGNGVESLFSAELATASFDTSLAPDPETTWVFTDDDDRPVVVHRVQLAN